MSDEQNNADAAEAWRKAQLEKLNSNPDEALDAIREVLGNELFEKTFGAQKPAAPAEEPTKQLDADGVTVLSVIDKMQRLPKAVERAVSTLEGMPFVEDVKKFVTEELDRLPVNERAALTEDEILGLTRLTAGLVALRHLEQSGTPAETPKPDGDDEPPAKPVVPDDMKAPRATIMAMKDALLAHGYSEEQVEAMCND